MDKIPNVLFVSAECAPLAKVGGLADVAAALPKALKLAGVDVRIMIPFYEFIGKHSLSLTPVAMNVPIFFNKKQETVNIYKTLLPTTEVPLYLLEHSLYFRGNKIYSSETSSMDGYNGIERFAFFSKAVVDSLKSLDFKIDIIHCNDYEVAIIPDLLHTQKDEFYKKISDIFTIHNLSFQGIVKNSILDELDLTPHSTPSLEWDSRNGDIDLVLQGIMAADVVTTVSPTYSQEIMTPEFGYGINEAIRSRKDRVFGILNGIDNDVFNPEIDKFIVKNYSKVNWKEGKSENKKVLQEQLGLPVMPDVPLLGIVNRLTEQKGFDLMLMGMESLVKKSAQIVVLGVGQDIYHQGLLQKQEDFPKNLSVNLKFDEKLAHQIYAGSDIFLMPSKYEPCGLGQMIAMRYGAIPVVRRTGGLADTVEHGRTGFTFDAYSTEVFVEKTEEAIAAYQKDISRWEMMVLQAMNSDFSWNKSAQEYLKLYQTALSFHNQI